MPDIIDSVDIVAKKRDGKELSLQELSAFFQGRQCRATNKTHLAAFLMAACINGMKAGESANVAAALTRLHPDRRHDLVAVLSVGSQDVSSGSKLALLTGLLLASVHLPVEIVSVEDSRLTCRPVEHLEWIAGFQARLSARTVSERVASSDIVVTHLPKEFAPACHEMDWLLTETGTDSSTSLLASVVLAPHIALGASQFVINVWFGIGGPMLSREHAMDFGRAAAELAMSLDRKAVVTVFDGRQLLGLALGAPLEVEEIVEVLSGHGSSDLREHSLNVAARAMLAADASYNIKAAKESLSSELQSGATLRTLVSLVRRQGGRAFDVSDLDCARRVDHAKKILAPCHGYVGSIDFAYLQARVTQVGQLSANARTGMVLHKIVGDQVRAGQPLASLVGEDMDGLSSLAPSLVRAFHIQPQAPPTATRPPAVIA